ncbi:MAG: hypothetical protein R3286_06860 [Gammaproteobacteria bacterium]|nr:hypothetical protein [Gammaproteobacteria bacterium]
MLRLLLILAIAASGFACAGKDERPAGSATAAAQDETLQLVFLDSQIFDEDLSDAMSDDPAKITVQVPARFNLNEIPDRLDRWLYAVKDGGGRVVAKPENPSRGLITEAIDVVVSLVGKIDEYRLYRPSRDYNATLLYGEDGMVGKVEFERR